MPQEQPPEVHCPKCNSNQIVANKKGFSGKKAAAGAILTGGIGLLAGTIGSNKIKITCLNCGHVFNPGEKREEPLQKPMTGYDADQKVKKENINATVGIIMLIIIIALGIYFGC